MFTLILHSWSLELNLKRLRFYRSINIELTNFWNLLTACIESKEFEILFLFLGFGSGVRRALISSVDVASVFT